MQSPLQVNKARCPLAEHLYLTQSCSKSWQIIQVRDSSILSVLVASTGALGKGPLRGPLVGTTSVLDVCAKSES